MQTGQQASPQPGQPWEYSLRKYLLLLATVVVNVTYSAGFNPPGGVWQNAHDGQLAGDPIILDTHHHRYLAFFYCNAFAFAASLVVIVVILILAIQHDKKKEKKKEKDTIWVLRTVMVLDLFSLMSAYGAGTCLDKFSTVCYIMVVVATVFVYIVVVRLRHLLRLYRENSGAMPTPNPNSGSISVSVPDSDDPMVREKETLKKLKAEKQLRKVLMLLATFAVSITYVAGLSPPGGFWDSARDSHRPGDAILKDHHSLRLKVFLVCNTTAFVASLLVTMLLIIGRKKTAREKLHKKIARQKLGKKTARSLALHVMLVGLICAYAAGSSREMDTTVYVISLVGVVPLYILLRGFSNSLLSKAPEWLCCSGPPPDDASARDAVEKARSLVLLLATLAATITYAAGLDPPGGLWQDDGDGHMAGDPILLTTSAGRYKAFFYCNSVALGASLVAIILVEMELLVKSHVLEAAMIVNLFGLMGAYAAGSCRDVSTSIYAMAMAGAVLIYVVIHVVFFTLDHKDKDDQELLEKRRKRLLLFAILAATITYQAGLTPPGGFLLRDDELGHHAGDPVLLHNFPRRYNAFFYSNSVSFMLSIALIILLVNPNLYRPAIRSNALSVCTAVGLFCLMAAYAAGSTQHIRTSICVFVLVGVVLFSAGGLLYVFLVRNNGSWQDKGKRKGEAQEKMKHERRRYLLMQLGILVSSVTNQAGLKPPGGAWQWQSSRRPQYLAFFFAAGLLQAFLDRNSAAAKSKEQDKKKHARRKYPMLLGILVASITYQAGLKPPGGAWQSSRNEAGNPVMHDNSRLRYLAFFYSNSISFVASIVVIIMLLPHWRLTDEEGEREERSLRVMRRVILLDLFTLAGAYAAGSTRGWKTFAYVAALISAVLVLGYFAIHMTLSSFSHLFSISRARVASVVSLISYNTSLSTSRTS